jgi:hypothetical protein
MDSNLYGLWIDAAGSVLVNGVTASNNTSSVVSISGLWIQNYYTPGKTVTVNQGNFNFNSGGTGLYIQSAGVITLNNIAASYNQGVYGSGAYLRNDGVDVTAGINILSTSGNNQFIGNYGYGLYAMSNGNITLSKAIVSHNGMVVFTSGAYLFTISTSSINITCSVFNYNNKFGLEVVMGTGTLALKSVGTNHNHGGFSDISQVGGTRSTSWTVCGK